VKPDVAAADVGDCATKGNPKAIGHPSSLKRMLLYLTKTKKEDLGREELPE